MLKIRLIGITPAGAGKTSVRRHGRRGCQDHPRRCGENAVGQARSRTVYGSPPQVRGKPAGHIGRIGPRRDHPRRCGENRYSVKSSIPSHGSPPQVRGKLLSFPSLGDSERITPAGAGKTLFNSQPIKSAKDHPRRCGENLTLMGFLLVQLGSPPQVRGKPFATDGAAVYAGITPAGAGKT